MPEAFVSGLNDQTRHKMIDLLNARLADTVALTLAVKQAHWNLKGPGYIGVHELLDQVADRLREGADLMAERAVILGGHARGTVEEAAEKSTLDAYPLEIENIADHVAALKDRFLKVGEAVREAIEEASDAGDADTEDLFTEVSRQIDKDAWFIGSNAPI
ncbi:DNA starvation/stationary phase protection protein Dps [Oceaniovalibus sp. ACAM 378]|jgi:starvation-inducible DNA-binding protein|uniref:DNA starvation/stationary phase protection protein Dps n=1 Tax=Oceaniovalibus sp. ACAM 378 TaxID=2599923 RepID=UPI0011D4072E|nr:DNA starvation/stationary phase protection protein Dps [Oceaniovalibus sp. ACAM 378]TYB89146.1 DNA starvation/stationary phase protection protein Dps [Oceaniovalibus sp. ACAM 378]